MMIIIYKNDDNSVAILTPAPEALEIFTIQQIAKQDVPAGKRFKIVDASELPQDVPQEYWEVDDEELDDGIGEKVL